MEVEGVALAKVRREALASLIKSDPERALELTVPVGVRRALPASVADLLEERISSRGRLAVLCALAEPGKENEVVPTWRTATISGRKLDAFAYGWRLGEPTRDNVPLNGIAVDNLFAVNENPVRILEPEEAAEALAATTDPICSITGQSASVNNQEIAADLGGQPIFFCRPEHAEELNNRIVAAEGGPPEPEGSGGPEASTWTEGQKKVILIRVDFPNLPGEPLSDSSAISLISGLNDFYTEMSYGRASFTLSGSGSDFTPTFTMPQPAEYYGTNNYYDELRTDARSAATAAGYVLSDYNFDVICMGSVPGWGWAGLGYVGAAGVWVRNSFSTGVTGHELGHNLGLNHANFWDTSGQSIIGSGSSVEYGDSFDTMGAASAGNNHFNSRYKNYLNWIKTNEMLTVTSNGTYRIQAHDQTNAFGLRALRIPRNATTNYWVEFRQKFTGNKWLTSGATLRWTQNGNQKSQLLDTTPGSTDAENDSAIVIGRTFSDKSAGIYITPVGKGGTSPESLDVVVNLGAFPANYPPTLSLTASATNVSTGNTVSFTATASDPNSDALAYYWDFGDGNFGMNGPAASKNWSSAGEYVVRCDVTDMKGGVGSKYVVVRVGSPFVYRINGRVGTTNSPVQGSRVYVSATRMAYTDSDGNYTITGLPAGSYTVNASLENFTFSNATFSNPVSVSAGSPNVTNINFLAASAVYTSPSMTAQPTNRTVIAGGSTTFSVTASGTGPLYYQWSLNGVPIFGSTASTFSKTNAQSGDAGNYSVVVSNIMGIAVSTNAALIVNMPPAITEQPQDLKIPTGMDATFDVSAAGTGPLSYRWRFDGVTIPGATGSTYTHTNVQPDDVGYYSVVVSNSLGVVTSTPAILLLATPPFISGIEIQSDGSSLLTLTGGAGDQYTIETSTNLLDWTPAASVTNATGQIQFMDSGAGGSLQRFYRARVQ